METGTITTQPAISARSMTVTTPTPRATVAVVKIKLDMKCLVCGNGWGLWVTTGILPAMWDVCSLCEQRQRDREIQQSYQADVTGRRKEIR